MKRPTDAENFVKIAQGIYPA